jgi:hypothetical protein
MARRAATDANEKPDASADAIGPSRLAPAQQTQIKGPFDWGRNNLIRALYGQGQALPVGLVYLHIQSNAPPRRCSPTSSWVGAQVKRVQENHYFLHQKNGKSSKDFDLVDLL